MKLLIEVELTKRESEKKNAEQILVERLYNKCDDWLTGKEIPELIFVYDEQDINPLDAYKYNRDDDEFLN